jgi:hypothetical protein
MPGAFTESDAGEAALGRLESTGPHARTCARRYVLVRRILRRYGYPPDKQEKATQTVLEQAELRNLCKSRQPGIMI